MNSYRPQSGFSIVEVMVALVVLAVGMLGIAGLYVTTLRTNGSAISRTQAVNLASDMADRIRANRFARGAYAGAEADVGCIGDEVADDCTRDQMAQNDLFVWREQMAALLPGNSEGRVEYVAGADADPDRYTITVLWSEPGTDERLSYRLAIQVEP